MTHNSQKSPISSSFSRLSARLFVAAAAFLVAAGTTFLSSCASKRSIVEGTLPQSATSQKQTSDQSASAAGQSSTAALDFVRRVYDGQVYAQNITGDLNFKIKTDEKSISLPGALHMRKDKVIRLQLFVPILGSEVGRLEFTPDHVLVVDRLHKQYAKATYDQVSFLAANGISYYSLQALFWNQLFLPGQKKVSDSALKQFQTDLNASNGKALLTLISGNIGYQWEADKTSAQILSTTATYTSKAHGSSTLTWNYSDFKSVGVKMFPSRQSFNFKTTATGSRKEATVTLTMSEVTTDSDWDAETTLSAKYKQIDAEALLKNLVNQE